MCLSQLATVAYGSQYMTATLPPTLLALALLAHFYLRTSQQLRLLDIELKAPVYTSLTETADGLATLRAFGWQAACARRCRGRVDASKRALYALFLVQRWLTLVLDLLVGALAVVLVAVATQLRRTTAAAAAQGGGQQGLDPAALGVGLSSVVGFSLMTSQFIMAYTELENALGAVARIEDCVDTIASEDAGVDEAAARASARLITPAVDWPRRGEISFSHVSVSYE